MKNHFESVHEGKKLNSPGVGLNPICKSIWLGVSCQVTDCPRAHPPRCTNADCLVLDQGLPRWKTIQCRNWHANPKPKKKYRSSKRSFQAKQNTKTFSGMNDRTNWPPLPTSLGSSVNWPNKQAAIPVWQNQICQNQWFKSEQSTFSKVVQNEKILGNDLAAWSTALPMVGSQIWGNQIWSRNLNLAYWKFRN